MSSIEAVWYEMSKQLKPSVKPSEKPSHPLVREGTRSTIPTIRTDGTLPRHCHPNLGGNSDSSIVYVISAKRRVRAASSVIAIASDRDPPFPSSRKKRAKKLRGNNDHER